MAGGSTGILVGFHEGWFGSIGAVSSCYLSMCDMLYAMRDASRSVNLVAIGDLLLKCRFKSTTCLCLELRASILRNGS